MIYSADNIINFRDLGGFSTDRGITSPGKAFRCAVPRDPTEKDVSLLKELGIKHVIDLRGHGEAEDMPSFFKQSDDFTYHHISLLEANPSLAKTNIPVRDMYLYSLSEYRANYAEIFRLTGSFSESYMFHCFLGKDRTGLLTALLLGAAGTPYEEILNDYELSFQFIKPFAEKEIAENTGLIWEQDISRLQSRREYLEETLEAVDREFGGITGYLLSAGLTQYEIDKAVNTLY